MPEYSSLDRPDTEPDARTVVFLGGPWDKQLRRIPLVWGMDIRVPWPNKINVATSMWEELRIHDYRLRYMVAADELICVGMGSNRITGENPWADRTDQRDVIRVLINYARKGMMADAGTRS